MKGSRRLLIVTQYFWPENFRINDLVAELIRRGYVVSVLTGIPNYPAGRVFPEFMSDRNAFTTYQGANIYRVPVMTRGSGTLRLILNYLTFALSAIFIGAWKLRGHKFDLIFAYEPSPITVGLPAIFMRYVKKAPLFFWVQDLWPETLQALGVVRSRFLLLTVSMLVKFIYKHCNLILAQSKSFIPQIYKYAQYDSQVFYFPNWSDSIFLDYSVKPAPEIATNLGVFNVIFAGNIGDAQDFPAIISAAEILKDKPNIRWLIIGDGRMASWMRNEIQRRQLHNQVLMLGSFPSNRMPSFFRHADALLLSLKDEPIFSMTVPSKLQTYLSTGIPILAMLNGEAADIVRESGAGLVCNAGDDFALAELVLKLSKMSIQERNELGRNGLIYSQIEFDRDKLISQLEKWIAQLCVSDT